MQQSLTLVYRSVLALRYTMVHYDALEPNLECYWAVYRSRAVRYTRVHGVPIEKKSRGVWMRIEPAITR